MISTFLENDSIWNHLRHNDLDFDFKSVFKAWLWFWFKIILKIILLNTAATIVDYDGFIYDVTLWRHYCYDINDGCWRLAYAKNNDKIF